MRKLVYLILLVLIFAGCKSSSGLKSKSNKTELSREINAAISSDFIEAKRLFYAGNLLAAEKLFLKCIELNPNHSASMFELSKLYMLMTEFNPSSKYAKLSVEVNPDNIWYQKQAAHIYQKRKMFDEAAKYLKMIIDLQADEKQHYFNLANNYIYSKDYKAALNIYDKILAKFGYEEGLIIQKKQIYLSLGKISKALSEIEGLINRHPENTEYYGMAADIYKHKNDDDKAMLMYQKILEIEPENGKVHLALADYYTKNGETDKAFEEVKIAFQSPEVDIDRKVKILLKIFRDLDSNSQAKTDAKELLELLETANPQDAKAMSIIADFLVKERKLNEAADYYQKAIKLDGSNYLLWEQLVLIYNELNDFEKMLQISDNAIELFPQNSALYYYNAIAAYKLKKYEIAIKRIDIGLNFTYKDIHFIDFYNLLAKAHFDNNDPENAYYNYQKTLSINNNSVEALSSYALALCKNNDELNKAEIMAKRALELNPDTSFTAYVFSYAKYKLAEFHDAKLWIDKAIEKDKLKKYIELAILIENELGNIDKAIEYKLILKEL